VKAKLPKAGSRKQEAGSRKQEAGSRKQEAELPKGQTCRLKIIFYRLEISLDNWKMPMVYCGK